MINISRKLPQNMKKLEVYVHRLFDFRENAKKVQQSQEKQPLQRKLEATAGFVLQKHRHKAHNIQEKATFHVFLGDSPIRQHERAFIVVPRVEIQENIEQKEKEREIPHDFRENLAVSPQNRENLDVERHFHGNLEEIERKYA